MSPRFGCCLFILRLCATMVMTSQIITMSIPTTGRSTISERFLLQRTSAVCASSRSWLSTTPQISIPGSQRAVAGVLTASRIGPIDRLSGLLRLERNTG